MTAVPRTLIAIGGAFDLKGPGEIFRDFIRRAGNEHAKIAIIPTASTQPDAGQKIINAMSALGLENSASIILKIRTRLDAFNPSLIPAIQQASGVFFMGGNQLKLATILGGTPVEQELCNAYRQGTVVAGTSAGAAILSAVMLAYGKSGSTPRSGMAQFVPGLGFTNVAIFDQHFRQRDRLGRLVYAVANNPGLYGIGVDENTAAVIETDAHERITLSVVGKNAVTIVDGRQIQATDVAELQPDQPVAVSNIQMHILTTGCTFEFSSRRVTIPEKHLSIE